MRTRRGPRPPSTDCPSSGKFSAKIVMPTANATPVAMNSTPRENPDWPGINPQRPMTSISNWRNSAAKARLR